MIRRTLTLPELALIAGTRAALGAGAGLLLADRLNDDQRRAVGWTLFAVGVLSTIPLAADVIFGAEAFAEAPQPEAASPSSREPEALFSER